MCYTYGKLTSRTGNSFVIFGYNGRDGVVTDKNGLIYMRARYYSPEMKRFVNADIIPGEISDSTSLNRYAYANGNPVSNTDPFGLFVLVIIPDVLLEPSFYNDPESVQNAINDAKQIGRRATIENGAISISMTSESDEIKRISNVLGMEKTCDIIATAACDKFLQKNGREFMLTDECVSKEIYDHVEAYYWSVGERILPNYLALGYIALQSLRKIKGGDYTSAVEYRDGSVYSATESIDVRESDIKKISKDSKIDYYSSQSVIFGYKEGLRDEYKGTQHDPWADERK